MKKITVLLILNFLILHSFAQNIGVLEEKNVTFRKEIRPAHSVVMETSEDFLEKEWKKYLKSVSVNLKKSKGVYTAEEVVIPAISSEPINLYTIIGSDESGARLDVFFAIGEDNFVSKDSNPELARNANNFIKTFVQEHKIKAYTGSLEEERKMAADLSKDHGKLIKEKDGIASDIEKYQGQINSADEDIISTGQKIRDMEVEIEKLKAKIHELKGKISKSQKELTGVEKKIAESQSNMNSQNVKVERAKTKLDINQQKP